MNTIKELKQYPFLIGITGHRDLVESDVPALRVLIDEQFKAIKDSCAGVPIAVMTCLAEGADQLCAEIALANDIPVISVLPLEKDRLEKDFEGDALNQFNDLHDKSEKVFVTLDMEGENKEDRDYWYRQAGIYIAERCQLLIALWDGKEDTTGCGTAAIIDYSSREWSHNSRGFAYNPMIEWIHVRRGKAAADDAKADRPQMETIGVHAEDVSDFAKAYADKVRELNACDTSQNDVANDLAVNYRDKNTFSNRMITGGSIATVLFFMLYDVFEIQTALIITLLTLAITAIMIYSAGSRKGDYLNKYVSYRILAETNRVQDFTTSLGKSYSVCDFYTYFLKDSYGWIEQAARAHLVGNDGEKYIDEAAVRDNWCHGQHIYHRNVVNRDMPKLKRQQASTKAALVITIIVYLALTVIEFAAGGATMWLKAFKVLSAVGSAVSLFASNYYEKQALEHKVKDSTKMSELYRKAYEEWLRLDEKNESKDTLVEMLARAEIEENGMWVSHQR